MVLCKTQQVKEDEEIFPDDLVKQLLIGFWKGRRSSHKLGKLSSVLDSSIVLELIPVCIIKGYINECLVYFMSYCSKT